MPHGAGRNPLGAQRRRAGPAPARLPGWRPQQVWAPSGFLTGRAPDPAGLRQADSRGRAGRG